jgi:hypothetical protein
MDKFATFAAVTAVALTAVTAAAQPRERIQAGTLSCDRFPRLALQIDRTIVSISLSHLAGKAMLPRCASARAGHENDCGVLGACLPV